jgi:hypothetical protein
MRKLLFILILLSSVCQGQVVKFMGRYDIYQVDSVSPTTWQFSGVFKDYTGSYTGLEADTNARIVERGYDSLGRVIYDKYKVTGIVSQQIDTLVVNVVSDYLTGIQNFYGYPLAGSYPISLPYNDTSKLTYRSSFYWNMIDIDYDAALDNLNLDEDINLNTPFKKEIENDDENNWVVPFTLKSSTTIFYNGQPLRYNQWGGVGSTTLTVNLNVFKYSYIVVMN